MVSHQKQNKSIFGPKSYEKVHVKMDGTVVNKKFSQKTEIAKDYSDFVKEFNERGI